MEMRRDRRDRDRPKRLRRFAYSMNTFRYRMQDGNSSSETGRPTLASTSRQRASKSAGSGCLPGRPSMGAPPRRILRDRASGNLPRRESEFAPKQANDRFRASACRPRPAPMRHDPSALKRCRDSLSSSANTATADLPVSLATNSAQTAISPRLATGILARGCKALARAASQADELGQNGKVGAYSPQGAAAAPLDRPGVHQPAPPDSAAAWT